MKKWILLFIMILTTIQGLAIVYSPLKVRRILPIVVEEVEATFSDPNSNTWIVAYHFSKTNTIEPVLADGGFLNHGGFINLNASSEPTRTNIVGDTFAYDFDGGNDFINLLDHDDFNFGNTSEDKPFTISVWTFMRDTNASRTIFGIRTSSEFEYFIFTTPGDVQISLQDEAGASIQMKAENRIQTNEWIFLAVTYDGEGINTGIKFYINGTNFSDTAGGAGSYVAMHNLNAPLKLAKEVSTFFNGVIYRPVIYSNELSEVDIVELFENTHPTNNNEIIPDRPFSFIDPNSNGYASAYHFDEFSGFTRDISGNSFTGILIGTPELVLDSPEPASTNSYKLNDFETDFELEFIKIFHKTGMAPPETNGGMSCALYIKANTNVGDMCFATRRGDDDIQFFQFCTVQSSSKVRIQIDDNNTGPLAQSDSSSSFVVGEWMHVGFTYNNDQNQLFLFINGTNEAINNFTLDFGQGGGWSNDEMRIGTFDKTFDQLSYRGQVDQFLYFTNILTSNDFIGLASSNVIPNSPVIHFEFTNEFKFVVNSSDNPNDGNIHEDSTNLPTFIERPNNITNVSFFDFDGINDFIETTNFDGVSNLEVGAITIWALPDVDDGATNTLISFSVDGDDTHPTKLDMFIDYTSDNFRFIVQTNDVKMFEAETATNSIDSFVGEWTLFSVVQNGTEIVISFNDTTQALSFVDSTDRTGWISNVMFAPLPANVMSIGGIKGGGLSQGFDGKMYRSIVYTNVLTVSDIANLSTNTSAVGNREILPVF